LSLLVPNIPLNTLFPNTPSLHYFFNVSDQVSHPYKTTGKIMVLYVHRPLGFEFSFGKIVGFCCRYCVTHTGVCLCAHNAAAGMTSLHTNTDVQC
jgi:hypothetical protein